MKIFSRYLVSLLLAFLSFSAYSEGGNALPQVKLETNHGDIIIELYPDEAPNSVANFLSYVEDGFYNDTVFHRVIKNFMIQGGGFTVDADNPLAVLIQKTPKKPIKNEANNGLENKTGSVSMARTSDPHSATAQFFINTKDNDFLNFRNENGAAWGYAVFGKVIDGMDVVNEIETVNTGVREPHGDVPSENIVINNASIVE